MEEKNIKGSSETTRGKYLNYDLNFIQWFIGFFEGDGCFSITNKGYLEFKITQSLKDVQVLFFIKKTLNFGSVQKQCNINNTHCYRVRRKEHILILITLLNGNLFLNKNKMKFKLWVNAYNLKYKANLYIIEDSKEFTMESAWLMGFLEAEGCFTVSLLKRSDKYVQVQVRFILAQKNEEIFMKSIAKKIKGKVYYLKSYDGYNIVVNLINLDIILNYISYNKFYTKKQIEYIKWLKIYKFIMEKNHLDLNKKDKLLNLYKSWKNTKI